MFNAYQGSYPDTLPGVPGREEEGYGGDASETGPDACQAELVRA
jgi:hypothetical protein